MENIFQDDLYGEPEFCSYLMQLELPEKRSINYWDANDSYEKELVKAENFNNLALKIPGSSIRDLLLENYSDEKIESARPGCSNGTLRTFAELCADIDQVIIDLEIPDKIVVALKTSSAPPVETKYDNILHRALYLIYDRMRSMGYLAADLAP